MDYADLLDGKVGEVASRIVANPKLQLEKDLRNLKGILERRTIPEEVQQRCAATPIQSSLAAFLATVALLAGGCCPNIRPAREERRVLGSGTAGKSNLALRRSPRAKPAVLPGGRRALGRRYRTGQRESRDL
jgi:hypothetical protein